MHQTLVQNSQHNVDHQDRHHQQHAQSAERRLKRLRRPLKAGANRFRKMDLLFRGVDFVDRVSQRHAGVEIERERDGGKRALVIHRERSGGRGVMGQGAERNLLAAGRRDVNIAQPLRIQSAIRQETVSAISDGPDFRDLCRRCFKRAGGEFHDRLVESADEALIGTEDHGADSSFLR